MWSIVTPDVPPCDPLPRWLITELFFNVQVVPLVCIFTALVHVVFWFVAVALMPLIVPSFSRTQSIPTSSENKTKTLYLSEFGTVILPLFQDPDHNSFILLFLIVLVAMPFFGMSGLLVMQF